jgi:putative spermidine/putrescine transport system substrate-binding protein
MKRLSLVAAVAAALLATTGLTACSGNGASSDPKTLNVYANGDVNIQDLWQNTLIPGFEKANPGTKVSLQFDLHDTNSQQVLAKLAAATKQKKDPGLDLVEGMAQQTGDAGLLADPSTAVPNLASVDAKVIASGGKNAIPYRGSSVLLAYNSTKITDPPKTLDALLAWIKANPGKFTYNTPDTGGSGGAFVATVLDKYVPAADRAQMTTGYHKDLEKDWDPGWKTLKGLTPFVYQKGVYPNGNQGVLDLLSGGQIEMAPVWSDQFIAGQKTGSIPAEIKVAQITNPSFTGGATEIGVTSASKKQALAFKFANWILEPAQQATIADKIAGYPAISLDKMTPAVKSLFKNAQPDNLRPGYNSDHGNDINAQWSEKVPGN